MARSATKIELKRAGLAKKLKSKDIEAAAMDRARKIAAAAGPGYEATSMVGSNRARASVRTATYAARKDNSRRGSLLRAVGAGRRA